MYILYAFVVTQLQFVSCYTTSVCQFQGSAFSHCLWKRQFSAFPASTCTDNKLQCVQSDLGTDSTSDGLAICLPTTTATCWRIHVLLRSTRCSMPSGFSVCRDSCNGHGQVNQMGVAFRLARAGQIITDPDQTLPSLAAARAEIWSLALPCVC